MALEFTERFCAWLAATPLSQQIQSIEWLIPAIQTVHILAVAAVVTAALMIDLRLLGLRGQDQALAAFTRRLVPFIWWPLPLLLATGALLIIAEPARSLQNPVFVLKMLLVVTAAAVTLTCELPLRANPHFWESSRSRRAGARLLAIISIPLWAAVVCAGRWIAYIQVS